MSSSHARLHFFLTSSFHRFFFHESVFFYENEQSHIQTIYYHQLLLKPTFKRGCSQMLRYRIKILS